MAASTNTNESQPDFRELLLSGSWLTLAVVFALFPTVWWGNDFAGSTGVQAALLAAGLCWVAGVVALVVRTRFPKPQEVVAGTLGAMLVRMGTIMGGALLIASRSPELVKAAFWGQVVVYFLLTLAVETWLAVRWLKSLESGNLSEDSSEQSTPPNTGVKAV